MSFRMSVNDFKTSEVGDIANRVFSRHIVFVYYEDGDFGIRLRGGVTELFPVPFFGEWS